MSEGPIKREREATRPPVAPKPPRLHDVVLVDGAPLGYTHWRVSFVPSTALGQTDIITLACINPKSPIQSIRRRVFQTHATEQEQAKGTRSRQSSSATRRTAATSSTRSPQAANGYSRAKASRRAKWTALAS